MGLALEDMGVALQPDEVTIDNKENRHFEGGCKLRLLGVTSGEITGP